MYSPERNHAIVTGYRGNWDVDIAILGFGTVGSGVMEVIEKNGDMVSQNAAQDIRVKYIVDIRDFPAALMRSCL